MLGALHRANECLKLIAAITHIAEEIEAGTARTQQDGVARFCGSDASCYAIFHTMRIADREIKVGKEVLQFAIVRPKEYEGAALFPYEWCYFVIVIALVRSPKMRTTGVCILSSAQ